MASPLPSTVSPIQQPEQPMLENSSPLTHTIQAGEEKVVNAPIIERIEERSYIEQRTVPVVTEIHEQPIIEIREKPILRNIQEEPIMRRVQLGQKEEVLSNAESTTAYIPPTAAQLGSDVKVIQHEPVVTKTIQEQPILKEVIYKPVIEVREQPVITEIRTQPIVEVREKPETVFTSSERPIALASRDVATASSSSQLAATTTSSSSFSTLEQITTMVNRYQSSLVEQLSHLINTSKQTSSIASEQVSTNFDSSSGTLTASLAGGAITTKTTITTEVYVSKDLLRSLQGSSTTL